MICIFSIESSFAQNPGLEWVRHMGGNANDQANSIAIDASGNVYSAGSFAESADFDPGEGEAILTSAGSTDIFVQKLDANGNFLWARRTGGAAFDQASAITMDTFGNVYITGFFEGTVDFNPGEGGANLSSVGGRDIFIQKFDANGDFLWVKQMGGSESDAGLSILIDAFGDLYTTGIFRETIDFDPGEGEANLTAEDDDIFVQKLDADGNFIWAKKIGGPGSDQSYSIATDASGNVYTTGYFTETADFDPGEGEAILNSIGTFDIFIQKLDPDGNYLWVRQMGGGSTDFGSSIFVDALGNLYTTGRFRETVDFDPGIETANLSAQGGDIFIQKLDANGNFLWVKQIGGTAFGPSSLGISITVDDTGNVYTTGYFEGTADFDPGEGSANLTSAGSRDIFIQKLDVNGDFLWVEKIGGPDSDVGNSITIDEFGDIYVTGYFTGTVDFGPGTETSNLTSMGRDVFVQKLTQSMVLGVHEFADQVKLDVYPNPSSDLYHLKFEKELADATLTITNIQGKLVSSTRIRNSSGVSIALNETPGIYLLMIRSKELQKTIQLIKE